MLIAIKENKMSKYFQYDKYFDTTMFTNFDLESHVINSYAKTFYYRYRPIPDIFDITDMLDDELYRNNIYHVNVGCFPHEISRRDVSMELIEAILTELRMEYTNVEGEHVGGCQNILMEDFLC